MLAAIEGYFENGSIFLNENAPVMSKTKVIVTFLSEPITERKNHPGKRILGELEGKIIVPDDFNEPLEDLKDYM